MITNLSVLLLCVSIIIIKGLSTNYLLQEKIILKSWALLWQSLWKKMRLVIQKLPMFKMWYFVKNLIYQSTLGGSDPKYWFVIDTIKKLKIRFWYAAIQLILLATVGQSAVRNPHFSGYGCFLLSKILGESSIHRETSLRWRLQLNK